VDLSNTGFSPSKTSYGCMHVKYPLSYGSFTENKPMPRLREKLKEIHGKNMNFKSSGNKSHLCEFVPLNTKLLGSPEWRQHSPDKWMAKSDFVHSTKAEISLKYNKLRQKQTRSSSTKTDPYIDGFKAIGDRKISRDIKIDKKCKKF
jgi:hypothetical protein